MFFTLLYTRWNHYVHRKTSLYHGVLYIWPCTTFSS